MKTIESAIKSLRRAGVEVNVTNKFMIIPEGKQFGIKLLGCLDCLRKNGYKDNL